MSEKYTYNPEVSNLEIVKRGLNLLVEKIKKSYEKLKNPELPKVEVDIYFSRHQYPRDLDNFEELFNDCDILFPETTGWNEEIRHLYRLMAKGGPSIPGKKDIDENKNFNSRLRHIFAESGKAIGFVDVPDDNPMQKKLNKSLEAIEEGQNSAKSFEEYRDFFCKKYLAKSQYETEREEFIVENFPEKMKEIFDTYPELKKKERVKVLLQLGYFHTGVDHLFRKKGLEGSRTFQDKKVLYDHLNELERAMRFGKKVDINLVNKAILEECLIDYRPSIVEPKATEYETIESVRSLVNSFKDEEVENILRELFIKRNDEKNFNKVLKEELSKKGF